MLYNLQRRQQIFAAVAAWCRLDVSSMRFAGLVVAMLFLLPGLAGAQAVADTTLKNPLPDSLLQKRRAEPRGVTVVSGAELSNASVTFRKKDSLPQPKRAAFYSAILPGAGQIYNRQYWKLPIVYGGAGAAIYFLVHNNSKYNTYRRAYLSRVDGDPFTTDEYQDFEGPHYETQDLNYLQDTYKRWLDLTTLLTAVGYTLQVLDALTFAHLNGFDVSRNISLRVQPVLQPAYAGVGLTLRW